MRRRTLLQTGAGMFLALAAHRITTSQPAQPENLQAAGLPAQIKIGYYPLSSALPFYMAWKQGWFAAEGLNINAVKLTSAINLAEQAITGELNGFVNCSMAATLALAEIGQPSLFKIFATNLRSPKLPIDKFIVNADSKVTQLTELQNSIVGCAPGAQNVAIAKLIFQKQGLAIPEIVQIEVHKHMAAVKTGQVGAIYSLEPMPSILKGIHGLEPGAFAKYVLDGSQTNWLGSMAAFNSEFIQDYPEITKKFIQVYHKAVLKVRDNPVEALDFWKDDLSTSGDLAELVVLSRQKLSTELADHEISSLDNYFQKIYQVGVFRSKFSFKSLLYA